MNVEHNDAPPRTPDQPLSPADGAIIAVLVAAMTAASVAGARDAMYGCFAAAGAWLLARLAKQERAAKQAAPAPKAKPAKGGGILWALQATPVGYRLGLVASASPSSASAATSSGTPCSVSRTASPA